MKFALKIRYLLLIAFSSVVIQVTILMIWIDWIERGDLFIENRLINLWRRGNSGISFDYLIVSTLIPAEEAICVGKTTGSLPERGNDCWFILMQHNIYRYLMLTNEQDESISPGPPQFPLTRRRKPKIIYIDP